MVPLRAWFMIITTIRWDCYLIVTVTKYWHWHVTVPPIVSSQDFPVDIQCRQWLRLSDFGDYRCWSCFLQLLQMIENCIPSSFKMTRSLMTFPYRVKLAGFLSCLHLWLFLFLLSWLLLLWLLHWMNVSVYLYMEPCRSTMHSKIVCKMNSCHFGIMFLCYFRWNGLHDSF